LAVDVAVFSSFALGAFGPVAGADDGLEVDAGDALEDEHDGLGAEEAADAEVGVIEVGEGIAVGDVELVGFL